MNVTVKKSRFSRVLLLTACKLHLFSFRRWLFTLFSVATFSRKCSVTSQKNRFFEGLITHLAPFLTFFLEDISTTTFSTMSACQNFTFASFSRIFASLITNILVYFHVILNKWSLSFLHSSSRKWRNKFCNRCYTFEKMKVTSNIVKLKKWKLKIKISARIHIFFVKFIFDVFCASMRTRKTWA